MAGARQICGVLPERVEKGLKIAVRGSIPTRFASAKQEEKNAREA
jgi:hypothetical protein